MVTSGERETRLFPYNQFSTAAYPHSYLQYSQLLQRCAESRAVATKKSLASRGGANKNYKGNQSCAIRSWMAAVRSWMAAICYGCYQSRSRPHYCSTYLKLRIDHTCVDERLDEKYAHTHTCKPHSDSSDDLGILTLKKSEGLVGDVKWGDAAKFRPQGLGGRNKMPNHDLMGYVSENIEGYAARRWIESCERACAGHGSLVRHVWQLDCCCLCK